MYFSSSLTLELSPRHWLSYNEFLCILHEVYKNGIVQLCISMNNASFFCKISTLQLLENAADIHSQDLEVHFFTFYFAYAWMQNDKFIHTNNEHFFFHENTLHAFSQWWDPLVAGLCHCTTSWGCHHVCCFFLWIQHCQSSSSSDTWGLDYIVSLLMFLLMLDGHHSNNTAYPRMSGTTQQHKMSCTSIAVWGAKPSSVIDDVLVIPDDFQPHFTDFNVSYQPACPKPPCPCDFSPHLPPAVISATVCVPRRLWGGGCVRAEYGGGGSGGGAEGGESRVVVRPTPHHRRGGVGALHVPGTCHSSSAVSPLQLRWESNTCLCVEVCSILFSSVLRLGDTASYLALKIQNGFVKIWGEVIYWCTAGKSV